MSEIADYMKQNPSLKIGIYGYDARNKDLGDRRASTVRKELINAGVSASRIETGDFGDPQLAREGRVEVLLRTSN